MVAGAKHDFHQQIRLRLPGVPDRCKAMAGVKRRSNSTFSRSPPAADFGALSISSPSSVLA